MEREAVGDFRGIGIGFPAGRQEEAQNGPQLPLVCIHPATLWPVGSLLSPKAPPAPPAPPCQPLCRSALKCKLWAPRPQILAQGEQG